MAVVDNEEIFFLLEEAAILIQRAFVAAVARERDINQLKLDLQLEKQEN